MKRKVSLMLVFVLVVSMFTMVGSGLAEGDKRHLTLMVWGSAANMEKNIETLEKVYPDFFNEVEVEVVVGGSGDNEVAEQVRLGLASREAVCDLNQFNYTQVPEFARAGVLTDMTDVVEPYADKLLGGALMVSQYDGQYVAVPYELKAKVMYYRKDLFDEAGVNPADWKTVDDMIAGSKVVQEKFPGTYTWNCNSETGWNNYDMYMTMTAYDARFVDDDGNYIVDTDPGVRAAMEQLKKIKDSGICYDCTDFTPDWESAFANSVLVGQPLSMWMKTFLNGYAPDQAGLWSTCLWPEEIRKGSEAGGSVYVIPQFSTNVEDAKEFLRLFRLEDEGALAIFEEQNRTPVTQTAFNSETMKKGHYFFGDNTYQVEAEASTAENFAIFPYTPAAVTEMGIFAGWMTKYMTDECSLDEALQGACEDMRNQIGNPFE